MHIHIGEHRPNHRFTLSSIDDPPISSTMTEIYKNGNVVLNILDEIFGLRYVKLLHIMEKIH